MASNGKLLPSMIFSSAAVLSTIALALSTRTFLQLPDFLMELHIFPGIAAFTASLLLSGKIEYKNSKYRNLPKSLFISIMIVLLSLIIWIGLAFISLGEAAIFIALLSGTVLGFITYPVGITAGLLVWWASKHNQARQ
ncbi:hypothetical protein MO867_20325 [Microbulbifer sp. OS29]|uniref:Uncharacterized protein n=1 Tax=Microbulbifer okhotskensis TaxID=2926617 RepID=A0A9X2J9I3_9GAMM|nr:hypothetical protein [Microbulbifer okhotskensis]MCO1336676.1 hypothetical protein [Microbulbifer okhotskensis]